jgi:hypothetical protein
MRRDCDDAQIKDLEERIEVSANQEVSMLERLNEYVLFPCPPFSFLPSAHQTSPPLLRCTASPNPSNQPAHPSGNSSCGSRRSSRKPLLSHRLLLPLPRQRQRKEGAAAKSCKSCKTRLRIWRRNWRTLRSGNRRRGRRFWRCVFSLFLLPLLRRRRRGTDASMTTTSRN